MAEALEGWTDFNVAMVGAAAALAGLLIVAMSVNIQAIMASPALPARAGAAVAALVLVLVVAAFGLMPGQPMAAYGVEVVVAALGAGAFQAAAMRAIARERYGTASARAARSLLGLLPIAAYLVGAALVLVGRPEAGLLAIAFGAVLAVAVAIVIAWVVLVEVLR
ncbi:hypothetical protein [Agromyces sp. ZXT2-6]|uniref:hypothetical protein n=1 Tax=Agromyces sp. ZXT2-6 TaxID=3461153 RepID=UPI004055190A